MRRVLTSSQMKSADTATIERMGVPSLVLMERAALAVVSVLKDGSFDLTRVLVLCGGGNNGGDGLAVARLLHLSGCRVEAHVTGNPAHRSEEHKMQREIAENYGTTFVNNPNPSEYTTIVDAVFGIGLSRALSEKYRELFKKVNRSSARVLAVDIPSGVNGDTGMVYEDAVKADMTVTFAFAKPGLLLNPGAACCGRVKVCDIGIYLQPDEKMDPVICQMEEGDRKRLPKRDPFGNKGTFGKVLLIAGSRNMSGAAYLAARACQRTGAGMIKIYTVSDNREILQQQIPEAMLGTYDPEHFQEKELKECLGWADVVGIGPGLGQSQTAEKILTYVMQRCEKPLVADADALNLLSRNRNLLKEKKCPCIVTPHMGEMARLTGKNTDQLLAGRFTEAGSFADTYDTVCVMKDARTVTAYDSRTFVINTDGNSGMATAGSGDVLTGIILGLLAQKVSLQDGAALGVWLHGKAGDMAARMQGEASMTAMDLVNGLQELLKNMEKEQKRRIDDGSEQTINCTD